MMEVYAPEMEDIIILKCSINNKKKEKYNEKMDEYNEMNQLLVFSNVDIRIYNALLPKIMGILSVGNVLVQWKSLIYTVTVHKLRIANYSVRGSEIMYT